MDWSLDKKCLTSLKNTTNYLRFDSVPIHKLHHIVSTFKNRHNYAQIAASDVSSILVNDTFLGRLTELY